MKEMFETHCRTNKKAGDKRLTRWYGWRRKSNFIERHFWAASEAAKQAGYFENLYVSRDDDHHQIQLFSGVHPIGSREIERDSHGVVRRSKLHSEHGACLVISQSIRGEVAILLYPFSSEKMKRIDPHIFLKKFDDPDMVSERVIDQAIDSFLLYMRVSSALFVPSRIDMLRIAYLEFRGKKYMEGTSVAKVVFSYWFRAMVALAVTGVGVWADVLSVLAEKT